MKKVLFLIIIKAIICRKYDLDQDEGSKNTKTYLNRRIKVLMYFVKYIHNELVLLS